MLNDFRHYFPRLIGAKHFSKVKFRIAPLALSTMDSKEEKVCVHVFSKTSRNMESSCPFNV